MQNLDLLYENNINKCNSLIKRTFFSFGWRKIHALYLCTGLRGVFHFIFFSGLELLDLIMWINRLKFLFHVE